MGKTQKKTAKGRLDKWYKLAKEQGYRSRAAYKLIQLNKKYNLLENSKVVIDLCAAPGGWLQVAQKYCKPSSIIVGVDLAPIKPINGCETFIEDITTDKCRSTLRGYLKTWKADIVLHDGAPNVGTAWIQDAYTQAALVLQALKLATEFLVPNGTFVTKIFRSKDYFSLIWVFKQLFNSVEATKPPSSRNISAEIFVVCKGYKAPSKVDPLFLNPEHVFADVEPENKLVHNAQTKVFHPEKQTRSRDGYKDGAVALYDQVSATEYIRSTDPIVLLASNNAIVFQAPDDLKLKKLAITSKEILACCQDLKVLGKKDLKGLLKWRLACRKALDLVSDKPKSSERVQVSDIPEEDQLDNELQKEFDVLQKSSKSKLKRDKLRKARELRKLLKKSDDFNEMLDDHTNLGKSALFLPGSDDDANALEQNDLDSDILSESESEASEIDENERLEEEMDILYEQYQQRKLSKDPKARVKMLKESDPSKSTEWRGIESKTNDGSSSENEVSDNEEVSTTEKSYSKDARIFFNNELFESMDIETAPADTVKSKKHEEDLENEKIMLIPRESENHMDDIDDEPNQNDDYRNLTAEALQLAKEVAERPSLLKKLKDDGYNKWAVLSHGRENMPKWFQDDEAGYIKPIKPITKEAVDAIKERMRSLNERPIKKVLEAKMRQKNRSIRKVQNMQKQTEAITASTDLSESEKAQKIQRMINRAMKKKPKQQARLVVAKGANKGLKSRPKGVKGKYKMVDARMRKELRAKKRSEKKTKRR